MTRTVFFILSFFFSLVLEYDLQAQNLIPNPGFEDALKNVKTKTGEENSYPPAEWGHPTKAKPDYYVRGKKGRFSTETIANHRKNQEVYSGHVMAGIMGYGVPDSDLNQYLQVKLKKKTHKKSDVLLVYFCKTTRRLVIYYK